MAKSQKKVLPTPAASIPPTIVSPSVPNTSINVTNSLNNSSNQFSMNNSANLTPSTPNSTKTQTISNNNNHNQQQAAAIVVVKQQQQDESALSTPSSASYTTTSSPQVNVVNSLNTSSNSCNSNNNNGNNVNNTSISNENLLTGSTCADNLLLDDDLIGHEIPTPECLPRKHSNIQSKLATTTQVSSTS